MGKASVGIGFGIDLDLDPGLFELGHHAIEIIDPEIDHPHLIRPAEIVRVFLERGKHRGAGSLLPARRVVVAGDLVDAEMILIPLSEFFGISGAKEEAADAINLDHDGFLRDRPRSRDAYIRTPMNGAIRVRGDDPHALKAWPDHSLALIHSAPATPWDRPSHSSSTREKRRPLSVLSKVYCPLLPAGQLIGPARSSNVTVSPSTV